MNGVAAYADIDGGAAYKADIALDPSLFKVDEVDEDTLGSSALFSLPAAGVPPGSGAEPGSVSSSCRSCSDRYRSLSVNR